MGNSIFEFTEDRVIFCHTPPIFSITYIPRYELSIFCGLCGGNVVGEMFHSIYEITSYDTQANANHIKFTILDESQHSS